MVPEVRIQGGAPLRHVHKSSSHLVDMAGLLRAGPRTSVLATGFTACRPQTTHRRLRNEQGAPGGVTMNKRPRQTRGVSRFSQFQGKESSLGPRDQVTRPPCCFPAPRSAGFSLRSFSRTLLVITRPGEQEARPYAGMDWSKFKVSSTSSCAGRRGLPGHKLCAPA